MPKGYSPSAAARTLLLPLFSRCCLPYNPSIPQHFSKAKNAQFLPVEGLEPGNMHFLHFSQAPPCVRPSISLVLPLFSQDISTATASTSLRDRTVKYEERLGARVPRCKCIVRLLQSNVVAPAAVKAHARTIGLLGSPDSSKQLDYSQKPLFLAQ